MTIKELATELNLSKVSVNKRIGELNLKDQLIQNGNRYEVPDTVADQVRASYQEKTRTETRTEPKTDIIDILNNQLEEKDRQIESLMHQLQLLQEQNVQLLQTVQQGNYLLAGAIGASDNDVPIEVNARGPGEKHDAEEAPKKKRGFLSRFFG